MNLNYNLWKIKFSSSSSSSLSLSLSDIRVWSRLSKHIKFDSHLSRMGDAEWGQSEVVHCQHQFPLALPVYHRSFSRWDQPQFEGQHNVTRDNTENSDLCFRSRDYSSEPVPSTSSGLTIAHELKKVNKPAKHLWILAKARDLSRHRWKFWLSWRVLNSRIPRVVLIFIGLAQNSAVALRGRETFT